MNASVVVLDSGTANLASMLSALRRLGVNPIPSDDTRAVERAAILVLPGVGSFAAGMARLRERGLEPIVRQRIVDDRPTLAVCLGLQLLCRRSEESPGVAGLDILPVDVKRFDAETIRIPQIGFNRVDPDSDCGLLSPGYAYYANSYRIVDRDALSAAGWRIACSDHGGRFVAAVERSGVLGCQFHPELSGDWGAQLLARWLERSLASDSRPLAATGAPC
jgi:imidazole glycerol phosphate synthase glutamine amidotransferase subunit